MTDAPEWVSGPGSEYFWGLGRPPTPDEVIARISKHDRVLESDGTIILLQYDRIVGAAWLHGFLSVKHRRPGFARAAVELACRIAKADGMRKVVVQVADGNPWLRSNRTSVLGFTYSGRLRDHFIVGGRFRDCCFFERFL